MPSNAVLLVHISLEDALELGSRPVTDVLLDSGSLVTVGPSVTPGQVVALTVPTWAPMFAFNVSSENTWRGSRLPEHCSSKEDIQNEHPQQGVGKTKTYGCYYSNARLLYTATLVKSPTAE